MDALFTATPFGYLVRIGDRDQLRGSYMSMTENEDPNGELMYNMLMWELEGQMLKMEQEEEERSVS